MKPFEVPEVLAQLRATYPSVDAVLDASRGDDWTSRHAVARLWLSEGIPYSFREQPGLYEVLREWLSRELEVHPKEITLVGSGRQGFCLNPGGQVGRPFSANSDLDFTVISQPLFLRLESAFRRWSADYASRVVAPRNEKERSFWEANQESVPRALERGFIDPHKIPSWDRYSEAEEVLDALYRAHEKLKVTADAPNVRKLSVRVYRDWKDFIRQMAINLTHASGRPVTPSG